jgi:hypothetical protein
MTSCVFERKRGSQTGVGRRQHQECATLLADLHVRAGHKKMFSHLMTFGGE